MQSDKTCPIVEQYLSYLTTIKGRNKNTVLEYRLDILQFFRYLAGSRDISATGFEFVDINFIRSIQLVDMYGFIAYHQEVLHASPGTRCRKIVSTRQFRKYLKAKVHLIDNTFAEELETPKLPKRIVRCLTLEESVRLLIEASTNSVRDNLYSHVFLNCALRLSERAGLNLNQVDGDILTIIGMGNKERKIYLTPAMKQALTKWFIVRNTFSIDTNALFISRNHRRLTIRSIRNVVKKQIVAAGINPEGLSTHKLRHTAATLMYKYGHVDDHQLHAAINTNPLAMMFN